MTIQETSSIRRTASEVWPYIVTPEHFREWNPNIASVEARDRFVQGQIFTTHYLWKQKPMQCRSVVIRLVERECLEIRHSDCLGPKIRRDTEVRERITLSEEKGRTVVVRTVKVRNHGIPWIFVGVIWLVTKFGKRVGPDRLKLMCEGEQSLEGRKAP